MSYKEVTYLYRKHKAILIETSIQNWNSFFHSVRKLALTKSGTFWLKSVLSYCGWSFFHFYSWFLKNFARAFKWDIICFLTPMGRLSKLLKYFSENQLCGILCPWVYCKIWCILISTMSLSFCATFCKIWCILISTMCFVLLCHIL